MRISDLSAGAWIAIVAAALVLLGLVVATCVVTLRRAMRERIARLRPLALAGLVVAAAAPWLFVWLAPVTISVSIHGAVRLVLWILATLLAYALLVLLPLAAVLVIGVWSRRARG